MTDAGSIRAVLPVRYPDSSSPDIMRRRGWWLLVLGVLIPGSAQVLAGSRRLGRFGLAATLVLWALVVTAIVLAIVALPTLVTIATHPVVLVAAQVLIVFYAVLWIVLTIDMLRLVRLVKLRGAARAAIAVTTVALLVVFGGGAAYGFMVAGTTRTTVSDIFAGNDIEPPVDGRYNILLLGVDSGPDRDGTRPDSISVVSVDAETGESVIFGLPRELEYVPFSADSPMLALYPGGYGVDGCDVGVCYLNSISTEVELDHTDLYPDSVAEGSTPGIDAVREAAEGALGLTIQYYVQVDMQGFVELVDALGGVTINSSGRYPINGALDDDGNIILEEGWIEPGVQVMDGYTALWYARSRYTTDDYDRMQRQREVQEAILRQFDPGTVLSKFESIAAAGTTAVKTDIPQGMVGTFVSLASKSRDFELVSVNMVPPLIDPEYPDYAYLQQLVREALPAPVVEETPAP
jgi:LCP family protein required for cell wall assembly